MHAVSEQKKIYNLASACGFAGRLGTRAWPHSSCSLRSELRPGGKVGRGGNTAALEGRELEEERARNHQLATQLAALREDVDKSQVEKSSSGF